MARIGIDLDGVLADFNHSFVKIIRHLYPGRVTADYVQKSWDWREVLSSQEYDRCFEKAMSIPNWWSSLEAYRLEMEDLQMWLASHYNHEIFIVTSRPDGKGINATYQSEHWLKACGLEPQCNSLSVITVPYSEDKVDICSRLDILWMIDDKPETIQAMDQFPYLRAGLMSRPWNQGAEVKWRVESMGKFLSEVK